MRADFARLLFLGILLLAGGGLCTHAAEEEAPAAPAAAGETRPVRIVSYNLYNFTSLKQPQLKSPESRAMVVTMLGKLNPDIAVLIELSGQDALDELAALLKKSGVEYPFSSLVEPVPRTENARKKKDSTFERRIGILSKFKPAEILHAVDLCYSLNGHSVPVQRGFAHLVYKWPNGYKLHLLAAHLKSKLFDPLGQTDMRRYEARLLRYLVNDILKDDPDANILLVGDFNDSPDSSPLTTLYNRRVRNPKMQLFDLRPVDAGGLAWTHLQDESDDYARFDYALASHGLLPEIDFTRTFIPGYADWYIASDHRPLVITLTPADRPADQKTLGQFDRNIRRTATPASSFHEGPVTGARKAAKTDAPAAHPVKTEKPPADGEGDGSATGLSDEE
jgi:endonuclease/exonuclease/phosphatase family metal-dependent hydrolase